jgi:hypothetical protein
MSSFISVEADHFVSETASMAVADEVLIAKTGGFDKNFSAKLYVCHRTWPTSNSLYHESALNAKCCPKCRLYDAH